MLMRTGWDRALYVFVLMAALIVLSRARASAQAQPALPPQSSQGQSPIYIPSTPAATPIPHLPPGSDVRTLPQLSPQLPPASPSSAYQSPLYQPQSQPTPPPAQVYRSQPVLPAVFRGCWEGRVEYLDSVERLSGGAKVGFWTPKTYRLCYRRVGNGPFVMTFTEAGIEQNDRITNAEGRMELLSSDGRSYASMRSDLDFNEYRSHAGYYGSNTFAVHEEADLDCSIESDGMHVNGVVTGWRDEAPWFRARWHTVLVRQGEAPQQVAVPPAASPNDRPFEGRDSLKQCAKFLSCKLRLAENGFQRRSR